jgi:hypothetical protein
MSNFPLIIDPFPYEDPATDRILAIETYVGTLYSTNPRSLTYRLNQIAVFGGNFNGGTP